MALHRYYDERLPHLRGLEWPAIMAALQGGDEDVRARFLAAMDDGEWELPPGVGVTDEHVAGQVDVPVRVYRPTICSDRVLVWVHGGAFVGGDLEMPESHMVCAEVAAATGAVVLSVGYRLAGSNVRYPLPVDDVDAVLATARTIAEVSGEAPLILGGASAGGAIALSALHRAPHRVDLLLLAYPFLHYPVPALTPDSATEMADLPPVLRFTTESIDGMVRDYVGRIHNLPVHAIPGTAPVPDDHPPTRIVVAEFDDLRPSGELLARQYLEAGVDVELRVEAGVPHGHLNRLPRAHGVQASLDWMSAHVREAVAR